MSAEVAIVAGGGGALGHTTAATLAAVSRTVVAADRSEQALRDLPHHVRAEVAAPLLDTPANRATFPAEVMTPAATGRVPC
jgi:NADP-dependent 3-hydroxy acid dehydrogenase YdfG